jgi:ABC-type nickel/cobalt efflux system permease component RcnA
MSIADFWFLIAIGGVLLVFEAGVTGIAKICTKLPEWVIKLIAGVIITVSALWVLWPKT